MKFTCNICGSAGGRLESRHLENPELPSCEGCGSNVRFRWLAHRLSMELFGRSIALPAMPVDRSLHGLGLTDPAPLAAGLAARFTYCNTFFDADPRFDIRRDDSPLGALNFLIASEVFEHVEPPVDPAFRNAARLLKPGGLLLFTTPWVWDGRESQVLPELTDWKLDRDSEGWVIIDRMPDGSVRLFRDLSFDGSPGQSLGRTREHFPELNEWRVDSEFALWNRRSDGTREEFRQLTFHGGPGLALEMRLFTRDDLASRLRASGFDSVEFDCEEQPELGIVFPYRWSHPLVARRTTGGLTAGAPEPEGACRPQPESSCFPARV